MREIGYLTAIFHIPDFQVAVYIHRDKMVSEWKKKMDLNTMPFKRANKLKIINNITYILRLHPCGNNSLLHQKD